MNAGLASTAPLPQPSGPQGPTAPGASVTPPKAAGEGFSAHLAKAVAVKTPPKAADAIKPTPSADTPPTETKDARPATVAKADRDAPKADLSDIDARKDEPLAEAASTPATDASAQPQAIAPDQTPIQAPIAVSQEGPAGNAVEATEVQGVAVAGFGAKLATLQSQATGPQAVADLTAAPVEADPAVQPAAPRAVQADGALSPALQDLVSEMTATSDEAQPVSAQAAKPAAPKGETPKKDVSKGDAATAELAKSEVAQATLSQDAQDQATLVQTDNIAPLGNDKLASATGAKAADTAAPTTKPETASASAKGVKAEASALPGQALGASVVAFTQTSGSGGETSSDQGQGSDLGQSTSKLASANEAQSAAPAPEAPQPLMPAPVHVAPQTLQTAAVVMKAGPQTVASLASQIVSKAEAGATRFDLELHPLDLGRVDVRLEVGASGQISAAMSFDTPQAAAEMRARSAELQKALENAGFDLSGGLSFDVAGDRGQGGSRNTGGEPSLAQRARALETATNAASDVADAAMGALMGAYGARPSRGVDIRI